VECIYLVKTHITKLSQDINYGIMARNVWWLHHVNNVFSYNVCHFSQQKFNFFWGGNSPNCKCSFEDPCARNHTKLESPFNFSVLKMNMMQWLCIATSMSWQVHVTWYHMMNGKDKGSSFRLLYVVIWRLNMPHPTNASTFPWVFQTPLHVTLNSGLGIVDFGTHCTQKLTQIISTMLVIWYTIISLNWPTLPYMHQCTIQKNSLWFKLGATPLSLGWTQPWFL
jgi:hypothetical protein